MRIYQFHFFDERGEVPVLDFADSDDDGAATRAALARLGQHGSSRGVAVFEGERLVARLERPAGDMTPAGSAIHGA